MDSADRDRALHRFVAGLPVDEDALADAVAARAVKATIVVNAMLLGLEDDAPVVRMRAARRVAELVELPPRLAARLRQLGATDADLRVREAAEAALRAHEPEREPKPEPTRTIARLGFASLWFVPLARRGSVRGTIRGTPATPQVVLEFRARDRADGPSVHGVLIAQDTQLRLELKRLPEPFHGRRVAVFVPDEQSEQGTQIGVASNPVDETGFVSIDLVAENQTAEDIAELLTGEFEIVPVAD